MAGEALIAGESASRIYLIPCDSAARRVWGAAPDGRLEVPEKQGRPPGRQGLDLDHEKNLTASRFEEFRVALPFEECGKKEGMPGDQ